MDSYRWKNTSDGRWERRMDKVEVHYNLVTKLGRPLGRQPWATTVALSIETGTIEDFELRLRQAWIALRYSYPAIACTISGDKKLYDIVSSQEVLDDWLNETLVLVHDKNAEEYFPHLSKLLLRRPTLFVLPQSNEVLLRCTHDWVDAEGMIRLLDSLLTHLSCPINLPFETFSGGETSRLDFSLPLQVAANLPLEPTLSQVNKAGTALQDFFTNIPSLGLPAKNQTELPSDTLRSDFIFGIEETTAIISAGKLLGISPTHIIHAACIVACYQISSGPAKDRRFASFGGIFALRRFCTEPARSDPMGLNVIAWPMIIPPPYTSFQDVAIKVRDYYGEIINDSDLLGMSVAHWQMMMPSLTPGASPPAPSTDPLLSSLGVIDPLLKKIYEQEKGTGKTNMDVIVNDFWMATNIMSANLAIHLWTWMGRMRLGVAYNDTFWNEATVQEFCRKIREIVLKGLIV